MVHLAAGHGSERAGRVCGRLPTARGLFSETCAGAIRGLARGLGRMSGLTFAVRDGGSIAATNREAAAAPGQDAGAAQDRMAWRCSGDVLCAAGSSVRGPHAVAVCGRDAPAGRGCRPGVPAGAESCGHAC
jgi:hypothetical protein